MKSGRLRRWIAMLAAVSLGITGCTSPVEENREVENNSDKEKEAEATEEPKTETTSTLASEHLLTVWSDYLLVVDKMYSSELWALDYVDAYLESRDWQNLTKARCACIVSAEYLDSLSMTEGDLDADEYLALAKEGVDTSYQSTEFSNLSNTLKNDSKTIQNRFLGDLEGSIVFDSTHDILKQASSLQREMISNMMQYTCTMTNYLLVSLGDDATAKTYWLSMKEKYPALITGASSWLDNENDLNAATEACLDDYEKIVLKHSELLSSMNADLYRLKQIIKNNDREALLASANQMKNTPKLLPMPRWYDLSSVEYESTFETEEGEIDYPESGEEITEDVRGASVCCDGVTLEEVEEYISSAEKYADSVRRETDGKNWAITMPDYTVKVEWNDQGVSILFDGQDVTFVPEWYLGL